MQVYLKDSTSLKKKLFLHNLVQTLQKRDFGRFNKTIEMIRYLLSSLANKMFLSLGVLSGHGILNLLKLGMNSKQMQKHLKRNEICKKKNAEIRSYAFTYVKMNCE